MHRLRRVRAPYRRRVPSERTVLQVPELPEVESVRRDVARLVGARFVAGSSSSYPRFAGAAAARGELRDVSRLGKWLILTLHGQSEEETGPIWDLVIHLGMSGRLEIDDVPRVGTHVHAQWELKLGDGVVWLSLTDPRRFGRAALVPSGEYVSLPGLYSLGPDALEVAELGKVLLDTRTSRRSVKAVLLDQRCVAGVGNIYCDEALFGARINPSRAMTSLSVEECAALAEEVTLVLRLSIESGGTTLRDYRRLDGTSGSNATNLLCYGRAGNPCVRCSSTLVSAVVAQRSTTWCPSCQLAM
jgi:formamidopyrimidine-DNA glycosylase